MVGVMTTDGGAHPADKWAEQTAEQIVAMIQIDDTSSSPAAIAARKAKPRLKMAIAEAMEAAHGEVMEHERTKLAEAGAAHLLTPLDPKAALGAMVEKAVTDVLALTDMTPFAAHFRAPAGRAGIESTVAHHFGLIMDIERSYHADANPDSATVQAYRAARATYGAALAHIVAAQ